MTGCVPRIIIIGWGLAFFFRGIILLAEPVPARDTEAERREHFRQANASLALEELTMGDKMVSSFLHGTTQIPVDFPPAPALDA
jgi:hypothetical protein